MKKRIRLKADVEIIEVPLDRPFKKKLIGTVNGNGEKEHMLVVSSKKGIALK